MERGGYFERDRAAVVQSEFIRRVYNWMALGLGVTALTSLFTVNSPAMMQLIFGTPMVLMALIIAELGIVIALSAAINRLSSSTALLMFFAYSFLNGLTLAAIFFVYTRTSIANTFFVTAGTFGVMSVYGYTTKRDLTAWGSFLTMGLIGIIIASLVNFFFQSTQVNWLITYLGVIIFVGLTAYDTQQIKAMAQGGFGGEEMERKGAVIGALRLYLDFINLFLLLLRIFGRRSD
jgi:uncharacterized protein